MSSCLGIYVDKNLIKYAKLSKKRDIYKVEAFNVETFENLESALKRVITETSSTKIPISINISNELYNYFDVFSILEKKDITKSLDIEFEMLCDSKRYDKSLLESRYLLMDNKEDFEKYKALYISANKKEINQKLDILSNYKLTSMTPVSVSITNLIETDENDEENKNVIIVNLENETKITTIIDGQITRVDILNTGLGDIVEKINSSELSWKKSYDVFKNIIIYNQDVTSLDKNENEYIDIVMPAIDKICQEMRRTLNSFTKDISKIYITGMGATISNIDLYFQDYFKSISCEILKPFFIDSTSLKVPTKEYIEVNSAIALALEGINDLNKEVNFAPVSKFDNIDIENIKISKEDLKDINWKEPFSIQEKLVARIIAVFIMAIILFCLIGAVIVNNATKATGLINEKLEETNKQISTVDSQISQIQSYVDTYSSIINNVDSPSETVINAKKPRTIEKDAIPNLLNKIMFIIPQEVKIISIENTENKHIVIEASSEKYEQLGHFVTAIKDDGMLINVQSTDGIKNNSVTEITIEGDLP